MVVTPKITDTDLTNMAKIQITESDIKQMVTEALSLIMEHGVYGKMRAGGYWLPSEAMTEQGYDEEKMDALVKNGVVPADLAEGEFGIDAVASSYSNGEDPRSPYYNESIGETEYEGEYDKVMALINKITDPQVKADFAANFKEFCEGLDPENGEFEEDEYYGPDPDDAYESWRDSHRG